MPPLDAALERAVRMVDEGAAIIDVGGESTRPGAAPVSMPREIERVVPVIERIARGSTWRFPSIPPSPRSWPPRSRPGPASSMTSAPCSAAGARASRPSCKSGVCLMHMQGEPRTMQEGPYYT